MLLSELYGTVFSNWSKAEKKQVRLSERWHCYSWLYYRNVLNWLCVCRCLTCFSCPCCFHTLSKRAANVSGAAGATEAVEDAAKGASKVYYLACSFCRWTSRDAGIKDQVSGSLLTCYFKLQTVGLVHYFMTLLLQINAVTIRNPLFVTQLLVCGLRKITQMLNE